MSRADEHLHDQDRQERLAVLHSASDLRLGAPEVRTSGEQTAGFVADYRADALRVFGFGGGDAVLVFGVLDGSVVRYLAEHVRSVVCVANGPDGALVQARCRGLSNVSVVASVAAIAHRDCFDVVVSLYDELSPETFDAVLPLIGDGTMVVWREVPNVGMHDLINAASADDSVTGMAARIAATPPSSTHQRMTDAGLRLRATLYPYPAVDAPALMLGAGFFRDADPAAMLDVAAARRAALQPADWLEHTATLDRLRLLVLADAAKPLMPERLVVASKQALSDDRLDCSVAAWAFSHAGDASLSAMETVSRLADGTIGVSVSVPLFVSTRGARAVAAEALTARTFSVAGSLRDELLRACLSHDVEQLTTSLKQWRAELRELEGLPAPDDETHRTPISGDWFDARMTNLAWAASDSDNSRGLVRLSDAIGRPEPVDVGTVVVRSLWYLAREVIGLDVNHPWSPEVTVDEMTVEFSRLTGDNVDFAAIRRWHESEADLLARLWVNDRSDHLARLVAEGQTRREGFVQPEPLGDRAAQDDVVVAAAGRELADAQAELAQLRATASGHENRIVELQSELDRVSRDVQDNVPGGAADVDDLRLQLVDAERLLDRQNDKIDAQSRLLTEVIRKYERAVHERNMVEQGMQSYRRAVTVAKKVMPTELYFKVRKLIRGH